jgi:Protein of unknown function, DUF488
MPAEKVVPIRPGQDQPTQRAVAQPRLFHDPAKSFGHVIFIDVANLSQDKLLAILSKNAVYSLIDVRNLPVFRKPKFNHAELWDYIVARKIEYIDLTSAQARREIDEAFIALLASQTHPVFERLSRALERGVTLILYENGAETKRAMSGMRNLITHHSLFRAELHPSTLLP